MKHFLIAIAGVVLCGLCLAQNATQPQTSGAAPSQQSSAATEAAQTTSGKSLQTSSAQSLRIAPGSVIPVELTKTIDAKKVKTGDQVQARVTQDMKATTGQVLVPKDTKIFGHITEDQARTKEEKESHIGIAFDRVLTKNGTESPLPMSIQAIIAPPNSRADNTSNAGTPVTPEGGGPYPGEASAGNTGRGPGMGGAAPTQTPNVPAAGSEFPSNPQAGANAHQPITGNTQGVVGISNLKLSTPANTTEGSLVSSEKNNVKLESGTFMLLRVAQ